MAAAQWAASLHLPARPTSTFHPICVCPAEGQQAQEQQAGTSHPSRAERAQRRWEQHVPGSEDEDDGSLSDDGDDPDLEAQMEVGLAVVQQLAECSGNPLLNSLHALGLRGAHVCFWMRAWPGEPVLGWRHIC